MSREQLKKLPAIDKWLASEGGQALCSEFSHAEVVEIMRAHLRSYRAALTNGGAELPDFDSGDYTNRLRADLVAGRTSSLRRTINATGIVIHTNLGRAPLAPEALNAINNTASGYSNLELDLESGKRGSRYHHVESLLTRLTGAEAAVVVNNCAAAVLLALSCLAKNGEAIISRGELVEIGGSFRMPDVIAQSGARMVEVGTTNKTHLKDYSAALSAETRMLLAIHPSNYRVVGFTAKPSLADLAKLAHDNDVLLMEDLGSGSLIDLSESGLTAEPTVQASLAAGADLVTFSGDKLLGGPQAGILLGRADLIAAVKKNPMLRALRIDKLSLSALSATLRLYMPPNDPKEKVPVLRMLHEDRASVGRRANRLAAQLRKLRGVTATVTDGESFSGGGALPMNAIPSRVIRVEVDGFTATELAARLRGTPVPVIGRITGDAMQLDMRTVLARDVADLIAAVELATT